jgi:hypothetical protein
MPNIWGEGLLGTGSTARNAKVGTTKTRLWLFFEQIFKGLARIRVARRRSSGSGTRGCRLSVGSWCGILFDGRAKFVKGAGVFRVFRRDALLDRLGAFELRAGIEEAALFAAVQFGLTLGTRPAGIETWCEDSAAVGTPRPRHRADHARRARAELIGAARAAGGRLAIMRLVLFILLFGVAVTAVSVLSIHKRLRPSVSTDCNNYNSRFCADALANLACIQSDCYTRPDGALIP